ncbi:c-type cytochrome [Parendozoicomonas haliclonae]|uniref:Cytochrome c4 n=1 Tax=Parendozoicomonas haliclonae TaxID=1960125 RepID=A0A1X7AGG2_9GAMM|nr:hypothetical protein [Parendozoicomonas haliclonae]SMA38732.1 Cytochrome c4 precursor [Parendozoicomonas haliclonae]
MLCERSSAWFLSLFVASVSVLADEPTNYAASIQQNKRYQKLLAMCVACHGQDGTSPYPNIPNLKWQNPEYMVLQLEAFRSGERQDKTMSKVARLLSPEDIRRMSHYFASGGEN